MSTVVFLHAHPDDEAISTGGSMARAAAEGHRVVLVVATNGEHGEAPDDLAPGETLVDRRRVETEASAEVLGNARVVWLGYHDSGMTGWEQNADPRAFHQADVDEAATRLAALVVDEAADVLVIYDWHGMYGHPDHIKVHHVGMRAGELTPGVRLLEVTMNRDSFERAVAAMREGRTDVELSSEDANDFDPNGPSDDGEPFGTPESELTLAVDVSDFVDAKLRSIACHTSQASDSSFFIDMAPAAFAAMFGTEWYIEHDASPPMRQGWFFPAP